MDSSPSQTDLDTETLNTFDSLICITNGSTISSEFREKIPPQNSMVVFVSSTFTDTHQERNILLEKILPKLLNVCNPLDLRVVLVDMRYGVRDENTDDHMTWIACEKELLRCFRESGSMSFLSIQGDKYGYRPIPKFIDKKIFETRIKAVTSTSDAASLTMVREWYYLDENDNPPVYVLRNLTDTNKKSFWGDILIPLRSLFRDMPFINDNSDLIIDRSVTEYETRKAMFLSSSSNYSRMYWLHRQFTGGVTKAQDPHQKYSDVDGLILKMKFDDLINTMTSELSPVNRIHKFDLPIESYINQDGTGKAYLKEWEEVTCSILLEQLDIVIENKKNWEKNGCGIGKGCINGIVLQEFINHNRWANLKCSTFWGRVNLLNECIVKVYALSNSESNNNININNINNKVGHASSVSKFHGICMCIVGVSGTGKTALMSRLAHEISDQDRSRGLARPVIIRFCGTTADSSNGLSLIHSISYQIRYLYDVDITANLSSDYKTAVEYFQSLLANYPVVLLVDSLDQLTDANEARSKISFLAGVRPHVNTRIIVSCLPDERDVDTGSWKYCYLCDTRLAEAGVARVSVPQLGGGSDDSISDMIVKLLEASKRRVTEDQLSFALQQVTVEPTALYVHLATRIMSAWRSYEALNTLVLQSTVVGVINQIIEGLEREFGRVMARCALGLMTFSVAGISDNEMQDLLSLDDAVVDSVFQYSRLETRRLPLHVWLRLRGALEGLVVERDRGCLVWYHRQLRETAEARYSNEEKKHLHSLLGTYFSDIVDGSVRESRLVARQPLTWTKADVWSSECVVNHRRCVEGGHHLCRAGLLAEAAQEICSIELICACAKIGAGFSLLDNIIQLHSLLNNDSVDTSTTTNIDISTIQYRVNHYYYWLRRDMSTIVRNPVANIPLTVTTSQPVISIARLDFNNYLDKYDNNRNNSSSNNNNNKKINYSDNIAVDTVAYWSKGWVVGRSLGGLSDFSGILLSLTGHRRVVTSVNFSPNGQTIVSGSRDNTVKIWDVQTGNVLNTLEGHISAVTSVNFSPNGQTVVSGSWDGTVKLWDVKTGYVLKTLEGHSTVVTSVNFSPDGQTIVSGFYNNTIKIWDVRTGNVVNTLESHSGPVTSVNFSPDGQTIISGSYDNTVKVWDLRTGNLFKTLEGHSNWVTSVNFSPDGQTIISGSNDNTVKVWDVNTGNVINTLEGHSSEVNSVNFSPDSQTIISGSNDNTVKVWDVKTGYVLKTLEGHRGEWVNSVNFSPDGRTIVSGYDDSTVKVWDVESCNVLNTLEGHSSVVTSVNFSPDGQTIVSGSNDGTVKVWRTKTGSVLNTLEGHISTVTSVNFSPDGQTMVSGSNDSTVRIWQAKTGNVLNTLVGHSGTVSSVNFSPDGQTVVSGSYDSTVKVWDLKTGNVLNTLVGHSNKRVSSVNFSPDGQTIVSGSDDSTVNVWEAKTGNMINTLEGHSSEVNSVNFSPDGQTIVSGSNDGTVKVWDVNTGNVLKTLKGHRGVVTSVNFSPEGQTIISGSNDNTVKVWDVMTGSVLNTLEGHISIVTSVNFSPDGRSIVSGFYDNTVKVWDVKTNIKVNTLEGHSSSSAVTSVNFSPDGQTIPLNL